MANELRPRYVERDRDDFGWGVSQLMGRAGLLGLNVSEEDGGQGAGEFAAGVVCEISARADTLAQACLQAMVPLVDTEDGPMRCCCPRTSPGPSGCGCPATAERAFLVA